MFNFTAIVSDGLSGGAANSTNRLTLQLHNNGFQVERWHHSPPCKSHPNFYRSIDPRKKRPPFERFIKNVSRSFADAIRRTRQIQSLHNTIENLKPALLNFRNIHNCGLDHGALLQLSSDIPIVWTMHDCWPFMNHAFKWKVNKDVSPEYAVLDTNDSNKLNRKLLYEKRKDIVLVGPSNWICHEAKKLLPEYIQVEYIPNGIVTTEFSPTPKQEAQKALGLDTRKNWFSFASTWANTRKGVDLIPTAFKELNCKNLGLLCWGGKPELNQFPQDLEVIYKGRINSTKESALHYSATDFFLCPSRADNLPNTILESMASGTPAIGSNIGGIPDMIIDGKTGYLHELNNPFDLSEKLKLAIDNSTLSKEMRNFSIDHILENFDIRITSNKYQNLFESLM